MQMQSNCLHLIPAMAQENYGSYECVSKERDYIKVVKKYHLTQPIIKDTNTNGERSNTPLTENNALAVVPHILWITLGLTAAMIEVFK